MNYEEWINRELAQDRRELGREFSNKCKNKTIGIALHEKKGNANIYIKLK